MGGVVRDFYLGALSTVLAYYWFTIGVEKLGATAASHISSGTYIWGLEVVLLNENLYTIIIGFVMILIGVGL